MDNINTNDVSYIPNYDQPIKTKVRQLVLQHSIEALTKNRQQSPVVTDVQFFNMLEYCRKFIIKHTKLDIYPQVEQVAKQWLVLQQSRIGKKEASDLHVLYLCGPNPLNDLKVLVELGVSPHNVWAVESEVTLFNNAVQELRNSEFGRGVKLHNGSLHHFLSIVPQLFDLVYFDACGPLFKGSPNTIHFLRELFVKQRLTPLSALITNFTSADLDNSGDFGKNWPYRLAAWYSAWFTEPDNTGYAGEFEERMLDAASSEKYYLHITKHLDGYYSDFISRFIIEFAGTLLPWWRSAGLPASRKEYFAKDEQLKTAIKNSLSNPPLDPKQPLLTLTDLFHDLGHAQLSKGSYPHLWTAELSSKILPEGDPFRDFYNKEKIESTNLSEAVKAVSLINNFFESTLDWAQHNQVACSPALAEILRNFSWFDSKNEKWYGMFCDYPLPNLIVDLLMGLYGYPYHINLDKLLRISYTAKTRPMYLDVFVFDQARYLYDLVPTLPLFKTNMSFADQLILRICMDAINRHSYNGCPKLYRGSALACIGEGGFDMFKWPNRAVITMG